MSNFSSFQEAYDDFHQANLAKNEVGTVYRLALCAYKTGNPDLLKKHLKELEQCLESSKKFDEKQLTELEKIRPEYEKLLQKVSELEENRESKAVQTYVKFHKSVSVNEESEKGRFVVSNEEIEVTEPILTERAFAFVPINPDGFYFDCVHCAATNVIPYP